MTTAPTSPLSELHLKTGATLGEYFGCLLPARFTSVAEEYRLARAAVALLDTNYQACFYFQGPDRIRYLNAITTNNVQDLKDGQGTIGLLLNPQGHILAELECYALADRLMVLSHATVCERTAQTLEKYIIMDDVTLQDASGQTGSLALEGPATAALLDQVCALKLDAMAECAHREVIIGAIPCRLIRRSHCGLPAAGAQLLTDREKLPALWQILLDAAQRHSGGPAGYEALNVLRLEGGIPWFSYDFNDSVIPHEAALEISHISYTKGCYTGQEIVERVRSRGHVNRRRVGLLFSQGAAPSAGAKLLADGKEAGQVTSAAFSPARGQAIGMGYVRREHNAVGSQLTWENGTAEVVELPLTLSRGEALR